MMQFILRIFVLAIATFTLPSRAALSAGQIVPGKWIVTLRPDANVTTVSSHHARVREIQARHVRRRGEDARAAGGIERQYGLGRFKGYAGSFELATVEELRGLPEVLRVEEDTIMTTFGFITQSGTENWGLAAISSRTRDAMDYIYDASAGRGTYNYIVDTGVRLTHQEFAGRAVWGHNAINDQNTDNTGHGTHVAGIIAGSTHGVAKNATVIAVKVFEGTSGAMSVVLSGFTWAVTDILAHNRTTTSVINLSLGGAASPTWDTAITAAWTSGVLVVAAAGNDNHDANLTSPGRAPEALCVGNLQRDDRRFGGPTGSNFGPSVDVWAPGTGIVSAFHTSDDAIAVLSGTSMAAPHVAGLVSYLRGAEGSMSAEVVRKKVLELGTTGRVVDGRGAADLVAYNGVM